MGPKGIKFVSMAIIVLCLSAVMITMFIMMGCDPNKPAIESKSDPIRVGIIDTGYDVDHEAFKGAKIKTIDCTGEGIDDGHGHGTATLYRLLAGIDSSDTDIILCKGMRNKGSGYSSEIRCCFRAISNMGAQLITYSGGSKSYNPLTQEGVDYAVSKHIDVFKSAGNTGQNITYPCKGVKLIGATTADKTIANYSAYKSPRNCNGVFGVVQGSKVRVARPGGHYSRAFGTSYSSPYAAGLIAKGPIKFIDLAGDKDGNGLIVADEADPKTCPCP